MYFFFKHESLKPFCFPSEGVTELETFGQAVCLSTAAFCRRELKSKKQRRMKLWEMIGLIFLQWCWRFNGWA